MPNRFDLDGRGPSENQLLVSGIAALVVVGLIVAGVLVKSGGGFDDTVQATALLEDVGDGLPARSDVKFRGLVVGQVTEVEPAVGAGPNHVLMALNPEYAGGIPDSVTARVVPSNVFAVSSVQLVDNGPAPALEPGAEIPQDESLETVQLQTALTKLREIVSATSRSGSGDTVGILAALAEATDRRGADIVEAGRALDRITGELATVTAPTGEQSTLDALGTAVRGLQTSAPDLLDALHHAVTPLRTVAEKEAALTSMLSAGTSTLTTVGTALENNTDQIIGITTQLAPVLDVVAAGSPSFSPIVVRMNNIAQKWFAEFWPRGQQNATGKFMFQLTPHRLYTRSDCPRYGALEGPSCTTAPETSAAPVITQNTADVAAPVPGGNVGPVGGPQEKEMLGRILGGDLTSAGEFLLGPLARGAVVHIAPSEEGR
ncbi:mce related protein [Rhodococcus triatomae BKS 15-14]|nr:mce related protein [Rhodococcus triatomae BKS 15-14]